VLVLGAGTDYALLLVARYREELRRHEDRHEAMALALRRAGPAIFASGLTVAAALLSLTLAQVNGTAGLGPVGATGVTVAMVAMLTFLPALLTAVGRRPFWPFVPRYGEEGADAAHGAWRRVGDRVARAPRRVAAGTTALLAVFAVGLLAYSNGLTTANQFRGEVESARAQELIAQAFPSGQSAPTDIVVRDPARLDEVAAAASRVEGVAAVAPEPVARGQSAVQVAAVLGLDPYSTEAFEVVPRLREAVSAAAPSTLVGGPTAVEYDLREASAEDTRLLVPVALAIVFIFLVALGVDYNIFLMARVREETQRHGTREGTRRGLAVTGGVITSAGIVLAGTFAVLAVLPLVFLTEIGFIIAFGVLLDTLIVRSVLVPALVLGIGPKVWWPSRLAREDLDHGPPPAPPAGGGEEALTQPARAG